MPRALTLLLSLAALAACRPDPDPCAGLGAACLAIDLSADSAAALDAVHLHLRGQGLTRTDYDDTPSGGAPVPLPFTLALVFDGLAASLTLHLDVEGRRAGQPSLFGGNDTALAPGEHRRVAVSLRGGLDGGAGDCPAAMVAIPASTGYCIDATEVTNAAYGEFLATSPTRELYPGTCTGPLEFEPDCDWPPKMGAESLPVTCVNWCNAAAFCRAAGKRLCRQIGGGTSPTTDLADATRSEWYRACSEAGARIWPYGSLPAEGACNGSHFSTDLHPRSVGTLPGCEGGYRGLFDMSGNAAEWEDSCDFEDCLVRGGSFNWGADQLRCDSRRSMRMYWGNADIGFRCCK